MNGSLAVLLLLPVFLSTVRTGSAIRPVSDLASITAAPRGFVPVPRGMPPYAAPTPGGEADLLGDTTQFGTTWIDIMSAGGCGRYALCDLQDVLQVAWVKCSVPATAERHIYWNHYTAGTGWAFPGGIQVEMNYNAGGSTLDADSSGRTFISYYAHIPPYPDYLHPAISVGQIPYAGMMLEFITPPSPVGLGIPRMQVGPGCRVHLLSSAVDSDPHLYYMTGIFNPGTFQLVYQPAWTVIDSAAYGTQEVGISSSGRLGIAWVKSRHPEIPFDGDVWLFTDDDGLDPDFTQRFNLTQFTDQDTLRAHLDASLLFDQSGYCHVAFTTRSYFDTAGTGYPNASIIWHWSEQWPDSFRMIADEFNPDDLVSCGSWNVKIQHPSLGLDSATGDLYCAYQFYDTDTLHLSDQGLPSGEVYISKSTDGGMNWSVGTNLTSTNSPHNAMAGECKSEVDPCLAKRVNGVCHIAYLLDLDAGCVFQTEGDWTLNPTMYHRVPVGLIPSTPLVPQHHRLHAEPSSVQPGPPAMTPSRLALKAFPNPFNPVSTIIYELPLAGRVRLTIWDTAGKLVTTLVDGWQAPGRQELILDGSGLSSGVYLCRLTAGKHSSTRKLVLLK